MQPEFVSLCVRMLIAFAPVPPNPEIFPIHRATPQTTAALPAKTNESVRRFLAAAKAAFDARFDDNVPAETKLALAKAHADETERLLREEFKMTPGLDFRREGVIFTILPGEKHPLQRWATSVAKSPVDIVVHYGANDSGFFRDYAVDRDHRQLFVGPSDILSPILEPGRVTVGEEALHELDHALLRSFTLGKGRLTPHNLSLYFDPQKPGTQLPSLLRGTPYLSEGYMSAEESFTHLRQWRRQFDKRIADLEAYLDGKPSPLSDDEQFFQFLRGDMPMWRRPKVSLANTLMNAGSIGGADGGSISYVFNKAAADTRQRLKDSPEDVKLSLESLPPPYPVQRVVMVSIPGKSGEEGFGGIKVPVLVADEAKWKKISELVVQGKSSAALALVTEDVEVVLTQAIEVNARPNKAYNRVKDAFNDAVRLHLDFRSSPYRFHDPAAPQNVLYEYDPQTKKLTVNDRKRLVALYRDFAKPVTELETKLWKEAKLPAEN